MRSSIRAGMSPVAKLKSIEIRLAGKALVPVRPEKALVRDAQFLSSGQVGINGEMRMQDNRGRARFPAMTDDRVGRLPGERRGLSAQTQKERLSPRKRLAPAFQLLRPLRDGRLKAAGKIAVLSVSVGSSAFVKSVRRNACTSSADETTTENVPGSARYTHWNMS